MKVKVKQVRSQIGRDKRVIGTLKALGLGRIGKEITLELNSSVTGLIDRVKQIVTVSKA
mgnify:CR=1 FL=1